MVRLSHVYKTYHPSNHVLKNANLSVLPGEFVYVMGPSGAGKTTLFRLITGFDQPTSGNIRVNGYELDKINKIQIAKYRQTIGVVFQDFKLLQDRNVFDNVSLPLRILKYHRWDVVEKTEKILRQVGLHRKHNEFPSCLSGGEKQRVAIARALVHDPKLIIADEPTGNLDWKLAMEITDLFSEVNSQGTTVFVATHDHGIVERTKNKKIIRLEKGQIFESEEERPCGQYFNPLREAGLDIL